MSVFRAPDGAPDEVPLPPGSRITSSLTFTTGEQMSDAIAPALTPDQWAAVQRGDDYVETRRGPHGQRFGFHPNSMRTVGPREQAAYVALYNHALPDGDPRKLTREDVEAVRMTLSPTLDNEEITRIRAVVAKLAALLPPEPSHG